MSLNGISSLTTKQAKQTAKLTIAEAKRQGKIVSNLGVITGSANSSQPFYRTINSLDTSLLPTLYSGNIVVDNANSGGLVNGRPWT